MAVVSKTVQKFILDYIKNKELQPGDQLPSERDFVQILEVSRSSVREALQRLMEQDIVEKQIGKGCFLKRNPFFPNGTLPQIINILLDVRSSLDLLEFRKGLEAEMAGLAAQRINQQQISILEEANLDQAVAAKMGVSIIVPDMVFHRVIAQATNNHVMIQIYDSVSDFFKKVRMEMAIHDDVQLALHYHSKIFEALKDKNSIDASRYMREHIENVELNYKRMIDDLKLDISTEIVGSEPLFSRLKI